MSTRPLTNERGPFEARQIRPGDRYELSSGHPIYCAPTGGDGARATVLGAQVIASDPDAEGVAMDAGFTSEDGNLRAPDISVGVPDKPGWIRGTPPLAVEYASVGQDEVALQKKITDLLTAGTKQVWVVRLIGPRRVEVHSPGAPIRTLTGNDELTAPGILRKPIQVAMLYDHQLAQERVFENLLERHGYKDLDAVRQEGREEGREEGELAAHRSVLAALLEQRFGPLPGELRETLSTSTSAQLSAWTGRILTAASLDAVFASP
jgi:Uma2 family endonuclease